MKNNRPDSRFYGFSRYVRCAGPRLWPVLLYVDRISIALSQLLNVVLGGEPHETLSSRAWRRLVVHYDPAHPYLSVLRRPLWWLLASVLEYIEEAHCQKAYQRAFNRSFLINIDRVGTD